MGVEYNFNKDLYFKEGNQYFAIEAGIRFNGTVCILWNMAALNGTSKSKDLFYSFAKIADGFYVDAYGAFKDFSQRQKYFSFDLDINSMEEFLPYAAKERFKKAKVPVTNIEMKRNAREFLRYNFLVVVANIDGTNYPMGILTMSNMAGVREFLTVDYKEKDKDFGFFVHSFFASSFVERIGKVIGFVDNKNWDIRSKIYDERESKARSKRY